MHEFHTPWHVTPECPTLANSQKIDEASCLQCLFQHLVTVFKNHQNTGTTFNEGLSTVLPSTWGPSGLHAHDQQLRARMFQFLFYHFCSCVDCTPCTHVNLEHLSICILTTVCWLQFPFLSSGRVTNADDQLRVTKDFVCLGVAWKETSFALAWFGVATKSTLAVYFYMYIWYSR